MEEGEEAGLWGRLRSWFLTWRAASHRHFGDLYADRESFERAIADLTLAIACDRRNVRAYVMRGALYWRELHQPERAIRDLDQALALHPEHAEAIFQRGCARLNAGDPRVALADLDHFLYMEDAGHWADMACRLRASVLPLLEDEASDAEGRTAEGGFPR